MRSSNNGAIAFRISGAIAVLLSLLPIGGGIWITQVLGGQLNWPMWLINILVPLVPGILALLGRSVLFLPVTWGWLLAGRLPKLLEPPNEMLRIAAANGFSVIGPYAYWATLCTITAAGLWLYLVGVFQRDEQRKA